MKEEAKGDEVKAAEGEPKEGKAEDGEAAPEQAEAKKAEAKEDEPAPAEEAPAAAFTQLRTSGPVPKNENALHTQPDGYNPIKSHFEPYFANTAEAKVSISPNDWTAEQIAADKAKEAAVVKAEHTALTDPNPADKDAAEAAVDKLVPGADHDSTPPAEPAKAEV